MIEKIVRKFELKKHSSIKEDLDYWLSKTREERIAAIEFLRRQFPQLISYSGSPIKESFLKDIIENFGGEI